MVEPREVDRTAAIDRALHELRELHEHDPLVSERAVATIRDALETERARGQADGSSRGWTAASLARVLVDGNGPRDTRHPIFAAFTAVETARALPVVSMHDSTMNLPRDHRAPASYWEKQVANTRDWVQTNAEQLDRPVEKWRKAAAYAVAADDSVLWAWHLFSTLFSAGASRAALAAEYAEVLAVAERSASIVAEHMDAQLLRARQSGPGAISTYAARLRLVALAHVFEVDDPTFDRVVAATHLSWGDRLLDRFIAVRRPEHPCGEDLRHPKAVARLDEVWTSQNPEGAMTSYLEKWYAGWKGVRGWGGHDFLGRMDYFGYWAFEAAGAVAVLGMDDARFAAQQYYPAGLLA